MKILRFTLSGKNAFFKKPEVNSYYYFTYGNIHKIALLGIFGAILGYGGYTQMEQGGKGKKKRELSESWPQFYERLRDLQVSVLPNAKKGFIPKKVQTFNNSVGYASKELGGNLIVKEQWLDMPSWDICMLLDSNEAELLADCIVNQKCVYIPYLGKNDHIADILNAEIVEAEKAQEKCARIDCLFPKSWASIQEEDEEEDTFDLSFKYEEKLPYQLNPWTNNYELESFIYTDGYVVWDETEVYRLGHKNIMFY